MLAEEGIGQPIHVRFPPHFIRVGNNAPAHGILHEQLGHVDANGVIQTKGRTACEINTANELVVVELIFIGVFNDLSVEQCMALLSCLVFDERVDDDEPTQGLKSYLTNPFYKLQECARTVAKAMIACKIELDEDEFVGKINPGL